MVAGLLLDFPADDTPSSLSPPRLPRRLRRRLDESPKTPNTVEQIQSKLHLADLRRQEHYEKLSNKARAKPRSPSRSSSQEEDLGERLDARLQAAEKKRCWRRFHRLKRTTFALAKAYNTLKLEEKCIKSMPFEKLAILIESTDTIQTVKALLDRLENRLKVSKTVASINYPSSIDNIDHLLKRVASPKKRTTPRTSLRSREGKKASSVRDTTRTTAKLTRYQVRVVLCAYMILSHPDAVFSGQGERETSLAKSAGEFVREFELLVKTILQGPVNSSEEESDSTSPKHITFRSQLGAFDKAWCSYLSCFVAWKVKDAQLLEGDLVRAACQMELSMIQTCKMTSEGDTTDLTHDMKAIQKQVAEDQKLLIEKVQHLSGEAGIERMRSALSETRSKYFAAKENGSPSGLQTAQLVPPSPPSSSAGPSVGSLDKRSSPSRVARSLFQEDETILRKGLESSENGLIVSKSSKTNLGGQRGQPGSSSQKPICENEMIVNEFVHEQNQAFANIFNAADEDQNNAQSKIRNTMEKAFWDGVMESLNQEEPNYDRVIQLLEEARDEICTMAPQSWKQEIVESIDVDILSQVLKSGNLDIDYLGKILEFSMVTLRRLSAPANDDEMTASLQSLRKELDEICNARDPSNCSGAIAMIKGLRFVLEQIQVLKREISKARIRIMEPLLKGPTGLQYLRNAFANRYGPASDANTALPLTLQWLSSVWNCKDQEWQEHTMASSTLLSSGNSSHEFLPSTTLRSGGSFLLKPNSSPTSSKGNVQPECKGEGVDLLVRLGLLKLVSGVSGLTEETLPETFMLNLSRLRGVQAQIQKIIVSSISILICRQTILSERVITRPTDVEVILSRCIERLLGILDSVEDAGMEEIVESISDFSINGNGNGNEVVDPAKIQSRKMVIARMLAKSLQAGDPVFEKVSRAVYMAARGVVLGGSGPIGRKLAETALRQVGAVVLTDSVVEAAEVLVVAATISVGIHGAWYIHMTDNM